jgi:hypothetical protein
VIGQKFVRFLERNQFDVLQFGECVTCNETVIRANDKRTREPYVLEPKPVGGTEINPLYDRHSCRGAEE